MSPLWQLTVSRFRQFYREPAAVFWVYGFPLILALALGTAFRNRPVEHIRVDVRSDGPGGVVAAERLRDQLAADERLQVTLADEATTTNRLRTAKTDIIVVPASDPAGAGAYVLDPNRAEGALARSAVDNAIIRSRVPGLPAAEERRIEEPGGR